MRVLVTGGTGFVGRHVVRELLSRGYRVGCLVRDAGKALKVLGQSVELYRVDFEDRALLKEVFQAFRPDFLVHLVGILYEDKKRGHTFTKVHHLYSKHLYETAREIGSVKRVVHMSALGTHPEAPSAYHRTKYEAEQELKKSGIDHTIMRPSLILGPEQKLFGDLWSITKYLRIMALPDGGRHLFQPVDVRDVACAFARALELKEGSKTYELCGSRKVSFAQLLRETFRSWGRKVFLLPVPKSLMYAGGLVVERLVHPPPFTSDQMLMMWKDNICGLDPDV
ncbi:MAG: NAD-dependent epimerase/dehydratase family protein, partial [Aquificaceae bacterium]|nr:NAD-dependent epimerase/dehydratase family protein [Aquificaceae bacterium]